MPFPKEFSSLLRTIVSPEKILDMSYGKVTSNESFIGRNINEKGIFSEEIFGPLKDYECHCGRYKGKNYEGKICEVCKVEVTHSNVRRERMGFIDLVTPVSNILWLNGEPSKMSLVLNISRRNLEKIIHFKAYIVMDKGRLDQLKYKQVLSLDDYYKLDDECYRYGGFSAFEARIETGPRVVYELLSKTNIDKEYEECRKILASATSTKKREAADNRLGVLEYFRENNIRPEWMMLRFFPVFPPEHRTLAQYELNSCYEHIVYLNNRIERERNYVDSDTILWYDITNLQKTIDEFILCVDKYG